MSCYLQKLGEGTRAENSVAKRFARRGLSEPDFRTFAETVCKIPDPRANPHFRSQHVGMVLAGGAHLVPGLWVGRFENLTEDFARVASRIGAPHLRLPHLTRSPSRQSRHYRDLYDGDLAERVGDRFRRDVELFGYSF